MPLSKENTFTTKYIYSLPEGKRAELIDGVIYDMAPPNRLHQELVMNLSAEIRDCIKKIMVPAKSIRHHLPFF